MFVLVTDVLFLSNVLRHYISILQIPVLFDILYIYFGLTFHVVIALPFLYKEL